VDLVVRWDEMKYNEKGQTRFLGQDSSIYSISDEWARLVLRQ